MHADICKFLMKIILKNQDYLCDTVSDSEYGVFSIHILSSYFGQKWYILRFYATLFSTMVPTHAKFVALCIALPSSET